VTILYRKLRTTRERTKVGASRRPLGSLKNKIRTVKNIFFTRALISTVSGSAPANNYKVIKIKIKESIMYNQFELVIHWHTNLGTNLYIP
jgi:hypothetical protein